MKRILVNIFKFSMCVVFGVIFSIGCVGCNSCYIKPDPKLLYREKKVGDFIVLFYEDYCEIYGTTDLGNNKKFLVIPEYIDGVRVDVFGFRSLLGGFDMGSYDSITCPRIDSSVLEKIYFEKAINFYPSFWNGYMSCPNLKKVMYPISDWRSDSISGCAIYYPRLKYEKGSQGYGKHPANISYYYNYEGAENDGYYWIDDCDYGEKIEYIPKNPERRGYTFGGWYKEPECINEWDFEVDTLPEEKKEEKEVHVNGETVKEEVTVYQETILYAKWVS